MSQNVKTLSWNTVSSYNKNGVKKLEYHRRQKRETHNPNDRGN